MIQDFDIHAVLPGLKPFTTVRNENDPKPCIARVPHVIRIYKQSDKASLNGGARWDRRVRRRRCARLPVITISCDGRGSI